LIQILFVTGRKRCVSFELELAGHGLRLCPSDLNEANFIKDEENRIAAHDFGGYSFLPPSFFAFMLHQGYSGFIQCISGKIVQPPSTELTALIGLLRAGPIV
jgi:hypothetical protein